MHSESASQKWLITGANGNLGKRLIKALLRDANQEVVAVVRSNRAQQAIEQITLTADEAGRLSIVVLDYMDVAALKQAAQTCNKVVHLVGILKATRFASYEDAHERSTQALLTALADTSVAHVTYMSIVGSRADAVNPCLASKGRAEDLCMQSEVTSCVIRVPMVLGEGDYASFALRKRAAKSLSFSFRAASLEQPIYAGDVVTAIMAAGRGNVAARIDLGGPEILTRRALTQRAANIVGGSGRVISLPVGIGLLMATLMEKLLANPPVTKTMLDVLDHDDNVDTQAALDTLALTALTPLDTALANVLVD